LHPLACLSKPHSLISNKEKWQCCENKIGIHPQSPRPTAVSQPPRCCTTAAPKGGQRSHTTPGLKHQVTTTMPSHHCKCQGTAAQRCRWGVDGRGWQSPTHKHTEPALRFPVSLHPGRGWVCRGHTASILEGVCHSGPAVGRSGNHCGSCVWAVQCYIVDSETAAKPLSVSGHTIHSRGWPLWTQQTLHYD